MAMTPALEEEREFHPNLSSLPVAMASGHRFRGAPTPFRSPGKDPGNVIHVHPGKNGPEAYRPVIFLVFTRTGVNMSAQDAIQGSCVPPAKPEAVRIPP